VSLKLSPVQSLKAVWYKSWTAGWAKAQIVGGAALGTIANVGSFVNDGTFKSYLQDLEVPKTVYIVVALLGIITLIAHGREEE
jgi:hypothetical protein